ncbi:uncharacterized protein AMSG_01716 [Thecamonas trahens ATCC 50062]|uniref:Uncharacterized protein n=1 Tax=Thecamonas trahens ATCC 50062 TaxID=461836 RepID=A0A0L0DRH4_THETB|nr:hypothetical protein AMSG_01716 [Thecamonas trahens ATCC 50062]KNC54862.1 hypothetical protein AMSG_01716 [Thecamonas trahens ATCC 50062]|eukprot:XP_013761759.1 hypothetical protein AMSG_01716 [Thecamonas trahens ATCC 50062]
MESQPIKVVVRIRPFSRKEAAGGARDVLRVEDGNVVAVPRVSGGSATGAAGKGPATTGSSGPAGGSRAFGYATVGSRPRSGSAVGDGRGVASFENWAAGSVGSGGRGGRGSGRSAKFSNGEFGGGRSPLSPVDTNSGGSGGAAGGRSGSKARTLSFAFDAVHDCRATDSSGEGPASEAQLAADQQALFDELGGELLDAVWNGYNCSVFSYGQTGAGKTYTMVGDRVGSGREGFVPRFCTALLNRIKAARGEAGRRFSVSVSLLEIYNEQLADLLASRPSRPGATAAKLKIREDPQFGPYCPGLTRVEVKSAQQAVDLIQLGFASRTTSSTSHNTVSSRSHAVFTLTFTSEWTDEATGLTEAQVSRINLVDLAGSERLGSMEKRNGVLLKETGEINKSLLCLSRVITQLAGSQGGAGSDEPEHVSYRDSLLTWLLRDSLGGNSKTVMVASVSPAASALEETRNTLRYAARASRIVNTARVNIDPRAKVIADLRAQVKALQALATPMPKPSPVSRISELAVGSLNDSSTIEDDDEDAGGSDNDTLRGWRLMPAEMASAAVQTSPLKAVLPGTRLENGTSTAYLVCLSPDATEGEDLVVGVSSGAPRVIGSAPHLVELAWDAAEGVAELSLSSRYAHCVIHDDNEAREPLARGSSTRLAPGTTFTLGTNRLWWFRGPPAEPVHATNLLCSPSRTSANRSAGFEALLRAWPQAPISPPELGAAQAALLTSPSAPPASQVPDESVEVSRLESELAGAQLRAKQAERARAAAVARTDELELELEEMRATVQRAHAEAAEAAERAAAAATEAATAKAGASGAEMMASGKVEALKEDLASYRSENAQLSQELASATAAAKRARESLRAMEERAERAEAQLAAAEAEALSVTEEAAEQAKQMDEVISSQGMQLEELSDSIAFLTAQLEKRNNPTGCATPTKSLQLVVARLKDELRRRDEIEADLRAQLGKSRDEVATTQASATALKEQAAAARAEMSAVMTERKATIAAAAAEKAKLGKLNVELERGHDALTAKVGALTRELSEAKAAAAASAASVKSMQIELLALQIELTKPAVPVYFGSGPAKALHVGHDPVAALGTALARAAGSNGSSAQRYLFVALNNGDERSERLLRDEEVPLDLVTAWDLAGVAHLRSFHYRAKGRIRVYVDGETYKTLIIAPDTSTDEVIELVVARCRDGGLDIGPAANTKLQLDDRLAGVVSDVEPGAHPLRMLSCYPIHEHANVRFVLVSTA